MSNYNPLPWVDQYSVSQTYMQSSILTKYQIRTNHLENVVKNADFYHEFLVFFGGNANNKN